eukprot:1675353-Amphidinium_carterae.1
MRLEAFLESMLDYAAASQQDWGWVYSWWLVGCSQHDEWSIYCNRMSKSSSLTSLSSCFSNSDSKTEQVPAAVHEHYITELPLACLQLGLQALDLLVLLKHPSSTKVLGLLHLVAKSNYY